MDKPTKIERDARRSLQADSLAASVVILLTATIVQRTVGFGRGVLFCRWLTPETLGEWEMVFSFLMLAAPLAVLGVPGSFGRYVEHYRQRGHLRTFLRRTAGWTACCSVIAIVLVECFAERLSELLFGQPSYAGLMRGIGLCLITVILHHSLGALLTALRLFRVVSAMNFIQSVLFAVISLGLMWRWPTMVSIVIGYSAACVVASAAALVWAWPGLGGIAAPSDSLAHNEFWLKLLRFAFFVWVTNLLANLFAVVDRYMLVHCAGMTPAEALEQVGHYHSSRVIPLLLASIADLLSGMVMPHLSHDWELGRRERVSARLKLAVKLTAAGMLVAGTCILAAAPFLFHVVFEGRYDHGFEVLPWTLAGCVWFGIYIIAQNYLWCAERTRLATAPLALGLLANVALNLVLLPKYQLHGAVVATAISTCLCLAAALILSRMHGMKLDVGIWALCLSPAALGLGVGAASAACAALGAAALGGTWLFSADERRELKQAADDVWRTLAPRLNRWRPAAGEAN